MLKIKLLHKDAKVPTRANETDAGLDLYAFAEFGGRIPAGQRETVGTGIAIAIPTGYVGRILPRSGLAAKQGMHVMAGVIDSSYRGEIKVVLLNTSNNEFGYFSFSNGDRIAQLVIQKVELWNPVIVEELDETGRGKWIWINGEVRKMSHTEGKLLVLDCREVGADYISISNGSVVIARIKNEVTGKPIDEEDLANARRLVATWNACDGIKTESLEGNDDINQPMLTLAKANQLLRDERDELVKALRSARNYLDEQYPMIDASELLDEEIDPILARYPEGK